MEEKKIGREKKERGKRRRGRRGEKEMKAAI